MRQAAPGHGWDRYRHLSSWTAVFVLALFVGCEPAETQQAPETAAGGMTPAPAGSSLRDTTGPRQAVLSSSVSRALKTVNFTNRPSLVKAPLVPRPVDG